MAKYFEVRNDNNIIVIDDTYSNLSFVHFSDVVTVQASDERKSGDIPWYNISDGAYGKYQSYSRTYTYDEVGLNDQSMPSYIGIRQINSSNPNEQGYAVAQVISVYSTPDDSSTPRVGFRYRIYSMELGAQYQMVSYAPLRSRVSSQEGLQIFNEGGGLVFDASYGFLQVMDSQYHKRDLFSSAVQSFPIHNSTLPDLDYNRIYLISRQLPFAKTGGTITVNTRQYVPRIRRDSVTGQLYVDLAMWGKTGGSRLQQYQYVFSFMVAYVQF